MSDQGSSSNIPGPSSPGPSTSEPSAPGPSTPGPSPPGPSQPGPSTPPRAPGSRAPADTRRRSFDQQVIEWTEKGRRRNLKRKQDEEEAELNGRNEKIRKELHLLPPEEREMRERVMRNEMNILENVHHLQREHPEIDPGIVNSHYLEYLRIPANERPSFEGFLSFKAKLSDLSARLSAMTPDQFRQLIQAYGGNLADVFFNINADPLRVLGPNAQVRPVGQVEQREGADQQVAQDYTQQPTETEGDSREGSDDPPVLEQEVDPHNIKKEVPDEEVAPKNKAQRSGAQERQLEEQIQEERQNGQAAVNEEDSDEDPGAQRVVTLGIAERMPVLHRLLMGIDE